LQTVAKRKRIVARVLKRVIDAKSALGENNIHLK
jgi:hypothetical protein